MTQTLELTAAELALIENQRKQEALNAEAAALRKAARLEKDIIDAERAILKEQKENNEQVMATLTFHAQLEKINPKYKMIQLDKEVARRIIGDYIPDTKKNEILKELKYNSTSAHITLDDTPFKIEVKKHIVYGNNRSSRVTDKGYKMELIGGGFYNERLLTNPKTLNKKIEDKLESEKNKAEAKIKKANALEHVFEKLNNLYPDATITKGTQWIENKWSKHNGEVVDIINIKLANGIMMKFRVYPDQSISKMELILPTKSNYELLELMNSITFPNNN